MEMNGKDKLEHAQKHVGIADQIIDYHLPLICYHPNTNQDARLLAH